MTRRAFLHSAAATAALASVPGLAQDTARQLGAEDAASPAPVPKKGDPQIRVLLREADASVREARLTGAPLDEVAPMRAGRMPTRRQIVAGIVAGAATMLLPRKSFAIGQPRVVIVGAGIAGLAAARALTRSGVDDVRVLELEDAAGGNSRGHAIADPRDHANAFTAMTVRVRGSVGRRSVRA